MTTPDRRTRRIAAARVAQYRFATRFREAATELFDAIQHAEEHGGARIEHPGWCASEQIRMRPTRPALRCDCGADRAHRAMVELETVLREYEEETAEEATA